MNCTICNEEITADAKKIELLCDHTFHTKCWLTRNMRYRINHIQCDTCTDYLISDEMYLTDADIVYAENMKLLFNTNNAFKNDLRDIHDSSVKSRASNVKLKKKQRMFLKNQDIIECVNILKNKLKELKKGLKETPEYKDAVKNNNLYLKQQSNFRKKWEVETQGTDVHAVAKSIGITSETKKYLPVLRYSVSTSRSRTMRNFGYNVYV